jgi:hypothetical protein
MADTLKLILSVVEKTSPPAWCSTRCPSCSCWPIRRCATAARCWRSSSSSPSAVHRDAAGRPHGIARRPAGAQHRPRRDPARPRREGLRRRAPPPARRQVPRPRFGAAACTTTTWSRRAVVHPRLVAAESRGLMGRKPAQQRPAQAGHAAGRRPGGGHQHADRRPARHRQVVAGGAVRRRRPTSAAEQARCSCSRNPSATCCTAPTA